MSAPSCYLRSEEAEAAFGELARRYEAGLSEEDVLAREALEALDGLGGEGLEYLTTALTEGSTSLDDPPEALAALFAQVDAPPFDVDHELIEIGARALIRLRLRLRRNALGIEPTPVRHALPIFRAGVRAGEALRRRFPRLDDWFRARNDALIERGENILRQRVEFGAHSGQGGAP